MIRQREAVHEHQDVLIGDRKASTQITVDAIQQAKKSRKPVRAKKPERGPSTSAPKQRTRCGKEYHKRDKCPAHDATCHKCQHKDHYSSQCFTKSVVATVISQECDSNNFLFLDTIGTDTPSTWMVSLKIRGKEIAFKVDTGAAVTAISMSFWESQSFTNLPNVFKDRTTNHSMLLDSLKKIFLTIANPVNNTFLRLTISESIC